MGSGTARLALLRFAAWRLVEKKGGMVAVAGGAWDFFQVRGRCRRRGSFGDIFDAATRASRQSVSLLRLSQRPLTLEDHGRGLGERVDVQRRNSLARVSDGAQQSEG